MTFGSEANRGRPSRHGALILTILMALLAGCKHAPPAAPPPPPLPKPLEVEVRVMAAPDVNPNRNGRPSPVLLHVFVLRDPGKFVNAEFDDVTLHADTTLAGALMSRADRMVEPGSNAPLTLVIDPAARLLGVIAEYSDLPNSRWRAMSPEPAGGLQTLFKDQSLIISLDRQAVTASAVPRDKGK